MGSWAFIVALFFLDGSAYVDGSLFKTQSECQVMQAKVVPIIANHNASGEPNKITHYVAVCREVEKGPQGKAI